MTPGEAATEKELPEIIPPPDREKALQKVKEMERKYNKAKNDEGLGAYATALVSNMPKGTYIFQVPGEFGNDTLCTDPDWHTTLNSLAWLGCPFEVEHDGDEDAPNLVMGDEVYDDAKDCLATLPERSMLADFVETLPKIANIVRKVQPAWLAVYLNTDKSQEADLNKTFDAILDKVEKCLKYSQGDLLEGDELTIGDLELAVTTYHMIAAFRSERKNWKIPSKFPALSKYVDMMHDMMCFKSVMPSKENVALRYKAMKQPP